MKRLLKEFDSNLKDVGPPNIGLSTIFVILLYFDFVFNPNQKTPKNFNL